MKSAALALLALLVGLVPSSAFGQSEPEPIVLTTADYRDCLRSLPHGQALRRTSAGNAPIVVPEHMRRISSVPNAGPLLALLDRDTPELAVCRDLLAAQFDRDVPRFHVGLVGATGWLGLSLVGGILNATANYSVYATAPLGALFIPFLPVGVPAWRQVGVRRALKAHGEGEALESALRREMPRALSQGFALTGAVLLGGSALLAGPMLVDRLLHPDQGPSALVAAAFVPHASVGVAFLIAGALFALPLPSYAGHLSARLPLPSPFVIRTRDGVVGGFSMSF